MKRNIFLTLLLGTLLALGQAKWRDLTVAPGGGGGSGNVVASGSSNPGDVLTASGTNGVDGVWSTPVAALPLTGGTLTGALTVQDSVTAATGLTKGFITGSAHFWDNGSDGRLGYNGNTILAFAYNSTLGIYIQPAIPLEWNQDTFLFRDAANTLALRNGANAQTFNIYNTYTDASNFERAYCKWDGNVFKIGVDAAGTGTLRPIQVLMGTNVLSFSGTNLTFNGGTVQVTYP